MPGPAFYITTVSGGTCVEKAPAGLVNKDCDGSSAAQQWTIQYKDNDPSSDTVAFQNVGNGEWMRATSGAAYGKIDTTASQQWWTLIKGRDTGSVWIKCNDYPDAYLCNANGSYVSNNTVYVWPKQLNWTHALTWYLNDANAPGFKPKNYVAGAAEGEEDLKKREAAVAEKEDKLKDLEKRESALGQKEQDVAAREAAQQKFKSQLDEKEQELAKLQESSTRTGDDASANDQKLREQLAELQRQLDDFRAKDRDLVAQQAKAEQKEKQVRAREAELERMVAELEQLQDDAEKDAAQLRTENEKLSQQLQKAQKASASKASTNTKETTTDTGELQKIKDENTRLRDLIVQQAFQVQEAQKARRAPPKLATNNSRPSSTNGSTGTPSTKAPSVAGKPASAAAPSPKPQQDPELARLAAENARLINEIKNIKSQASKAPATPAGGTAGANISSPRRQQSTAAKQASTPSPTIKTPSSPSSNNADTIKAENARLKAQRDNLLKKQKALGELSHAATKGVAQSSGALYTKTPEVKRVLNDGEGGELDAIEFDCGHILHAPPRKIEKRVVGLLYQ